MSKAVEMKCYLLRADGTMQTIKGVFNFHDLKTILGVDVVEVCECIVDEFLMLIDEEGKLKRNAYNVTATEWYKFAKARNGAYVDAIVGNVLLVATQAWIEMNSDEDED